MSMQESLGLIVDSDASWTRRKCGHVKYMKSQRPDLGTSAPQKWFYRNWDPSFACEYSRRIGRIGDGGKWICDPHRINRQDRTEPCLVYSIGSFGEASFEMSVKEAFPNCEIHTFDPHPWEYYNRKKQRATVMPSWLHYHAFGLAAKDTSDPAHGNFKTMKTIAKELGHIGRTIEIFKIDCDGCEWSTYPGWFTEDLKIRQINVELHPQGRPQESLDATASRFFKYLQDKGYVIHYKESNTHGCSGVCIEYGLVLLRPGLFQSGDACEA